MDPREIDSLAHRTAMLLTSETLNRIASGEVTLAFRRWRRPTVKAGGTLLTAIGQLAIEAVDEIELDEIGEDEAAAAGFGTAEQLRDALLERPDGRFYRVRLALLGADPRVALRNAVPDERELADLASRLAGMDAGSPDGPWTTAFLDLIRARPAERAAELARHHGMELPEFKRKVRKLKALGLTESLPLGYRISPRGEAVLLGQRERTALRTPAKGARNG